ncbi:MAG: hypothetical protein JXA28_05800, partial [Bacteroidetes bacterium]|nr:hypothetical protein [Bacteroidota bacterium]
MLRSLTLSALFLLGLIQSGSAQPGIHEPLSLTRLDATHWRVDGRNLEPRVLPPSGDPLRSRVLMPGYADCLEVGHPVLPVRVLHFGLPPGGSLRIRIAGVREESFSAELLCYGDTPADTLLPLVEILPVVTRQGLRIGGVRLHPVRYDAQRDELRWARSITVDIEIAGDQGGVAVADPALLSELVNGTDAGAWGFIPSPLRKSVAAFRAGERILNIRTATEGMYR